jgi:glucose/arabinose dehydrogenase
MRLLASLVGTVALAALARAGTPPPGFVETPVATGLSLPIAIAFLPDDRMLVTEKAGRLLLVDGGTVTPLVTIPVCTAGDMGLAGVAVDPDFATNGFIYVYRTESDGGCGGGPGRSNEVIRLTMAPDGTVSLASLVVLLGGIPTQSGFHQGGCLRVGSDGKLYVTVGDGAVGDNAGCPGTSTNPFAQDLNALGGKLLRLDLDGTIPSDNPFVGVVGTRGEIFASGFRNPYRFTFDPVSGGLWLADVGDLAWEEIDLVTAGGNYGWPLCEAEHPAGCPLPGQIGPIFRYSHAGACPDEGSVPTLGRSITGGVFTTTSFGGFGGQYFFGDWVANTIYRAVPNGTRDGLAGPPTIFATGASGNVDFAFACDSLFYVSVFTGQVLRISPLPSGNDTPIAGKTLVLKDEVGDPSKKRMLVRSTDLAVDLGGGNGSADDPVLNPGSQVQVTSAFFDLTYPLPMGNFDYLGDPGDNEGYKYRDRDLSDGPIKALTIKNGKLVRIVGRGTALGHALTTNPVPVNVVLTLAGRTHSMRFGGSVKFERNARYRAKNAAAPTTLCP